MTAASSSGPRRRNLTTDGNHRYRSFVSRAFYVFALCSTFFGLAMLIIFFISIGVNVANWFQTMPQLVREENERLLDRAENRYREELAKIDAQITAEFAGDLAQAKTAEERAKLQEEMAELRAEKVKDLDKSAIEWRIEAEKGVRPFQTPTALLKHFLTESPEAEAPAAGIMPALLGSLYVGLITIVFALPLGVGAAIFLEEYQQNNRLARFIQVNINNLAGVPSILYGILGAAIFVDAVFKPLHHHFEWIADRNLLGAGLTLALLTLPLIIVASQEAIRAVPQSLRHGALALGAMRWQTIWKIVLPSALPGILTGMILAICRAMGEAAPLVMFGALLFVTDPPTLFSRFGVLPMQIYDWTGRPEAGWLDNAALASAVLVGMVLLLNGAAIYLLQRAQGQTRY